MKKTLHVVYASDNRFAEILGVSLLSLYDNNKDMETIVIYILDNGISEENKKRIEQISIMYNRSLPQWIQAIDVSKKLQMDVWIDRGSLSQYARLFVSSVLPETLDRVLYLDCDIVINEALDELWNIDLQGKTIAALDDAFSKLYRMNIDLNPMDIMFNSGVMIIDLKRWKEQEVENKLMKFIVSKKGKIQQGDQGALNAVLSHDIYCFEPRFNSVTLYYDFSYQELITYRKPARLYAEDEIKRAIEEPVIIHFTTSFLSRRPWIKGCKHKYVEKWLKYKAMSPFRDGELWEYTKPSGLKGIYLGVMRHMPRAVLIGVSGVLQAYGRPLINKVLLKGK